MISDFFKQNPLSKIFIYLLPQVLGYLILVLFFYVCWFYEPKKSAVLPMLYAFSMGVIDFRSLIFKHENGIEKPFFVTFCYLSRAAFLGVDLVYNIFSFWFWLGMVEVFRHYGQFQGGFYSKRTISVLEYDFNRIKSRIYEKSYLAVTNENKVYGFSYKGIFGPIQSSVELCGDQIILMTYPQRFSFYTLFGFNSSFNGKEGERLTNDLLGASKISHEKNEEF